METIHDNNNIKLLYSNYIPDEYIEWELAPIYKPFYLYNKLNNVMCPRPNEMEEWMLGEKPLYKAEFYNEKNKHKLFYMRLYIVSTSPKRFHLYIKGNLSNWYYQESLERDLSSDEYDNCLKLLLKQIGVKESQKSSNSSYDILIEDQITLHSYQLSL